MGRLSSGAWTPGYRRPGSRKGHVSACKPPAYYNSGANEAGGNLAIQVSLSLFHASLVHKVCGPSPEQAPALLTPAALLCSPGIALVSAAALPSPSPLPAAPQPTGISPHGGVRGLTGLCHGQRHGGEPVRLPETGGMAGGGAVKATPLPGAITGSASALTTTTRKQS